jgi:superfamily II RNA helicase
MGLEINLLVPDLWQQEAVRALQNGQDVVVHAPTGAGKTYIFELLYPSLKGQAVFTVPTRALANDKLAEWRARGWDVGIATGDLTLNPDAKVVVATLETQRARFLRRQGPRLLVVDEYQLIADPVRGVHYELSLALAPPETQLCFSAGALIIHRTWSNGCGVMDVIRCSSGMMSARCRNMKSICAIFQRSAFSRCANFGRG